MMKRAISALYALSALIPAQGALASPDDRFREDLTNCTVEAQRPRLGDDAFACSICGVSAGCTGTSCHWGALNFSGESSEAVLDAVDRGFPLYCANSGGFLTGAGSISGVQSRSYGAVLGRAERGQSSAGVGGGVLELASSRHRGVREADVDSTAFGVALPFALSSDSGLFKNVDVSGLVIAAFGGGVWQAGISGAPMYTRLVVGRGRDDTFKVVIGAAANFHFVLTGGDTFDPGLNWSIGASALCGVTQRIGSASVGAGVVLDARYLDGPQLPLQVVARASYDVGFGHIVVQPAVSVELTEGAGLMDSAQIVALAGGSIGDWVFGYQGFFNASSMSHGIGVSYAGLGGALAAGYGTHEDEGPVIADAASSDEAIAVVPSQPSDASAGAAPIVTAPIATPQIATAPATNDVAAGASPGSAASAPTPEAPAIAAPPTPTPAPIPATELAPPTPAIAPTPTPPPTPAIAAPSTPAIAPPPTPPTTPAIVPSPATPAIAPSAGATSSATTATPPIAPAPVVATPTLAAPVPTSTLAAPTDFVSEQALRDHARALLDADRVQDAVAALSARELVEGASLSALANALLRAGRVADAAAMMERAVAREPKEAAHLYNLVRLLRMLGERDRASGLRDQGRKLFPGDPRFRE